MATRRRYATRAELAERIAPHLRALEELDPHNGFSWEDLAKAALDGLAELGAPVDSLVKITVDEEV